MVCAIRCCVSACVYVCVPFVIDGVLLNGSLLGCVFVVRVCAGACVLF